MKSSRKTIDTYVNAYWFIFNDQGLLVTSNNASVPFGLAIASFNIDASNSINIGCIDNKPCYAVMAVDCAELPHGFIWQPLRDCGVIFSSDFFAMACRAWHLLQWDKKHTFCSACAAKLNLKSDEHAKICPACHTISYPKISPSIIVLVKRNKELLLARSPHFKSGVYSTLAGFIEPGESAEAAVVREVQEEVGIRIKNLRYFGSQPWPFPDSLMIGFNAEYASGEITIDKNEIEDAGWFTLDNLPLLPSPASIAYHLIMQGLK